uniref:Ribosomal protein S3 n=1 Tax=Glaucocystis nostochinearum TaxID=38271 RepID=E9P6E0_9EUKA|nr:ribosomal protein S3 [Glaucocystis nostochinearum]ADW83124.1 ribosomal protein S3 [Glaucocystis nostochinearum]
MGKKINPIIFRYNTNQTWQYIWHTPINKKHEYSAQFFINFFIDKYLKNIFINKNIVISKIFLLSNWNKIKIFFYLFPYLNIINNKIEINFKQSFIKKIKKNTISILQKYLKKKIFLNIFTDKNCIINEDALISNLSFEIKKTKNIKNIIKKLFIKIKNYPQIIGLKILIKGRLTKNDQATIIYLQKGKIPFNTIKSNILFAKNWIITRRGTYGIKIWIHVRSNTKFLRKFYKKHVITA